MYSYWTLGLGGARLVPISRKLLSNKNMELEKVGTCVIIHMKCRPNVITPEFIAMLNEALDKVLAYEDAKAVVTTGEGKFYSHGVGVDVVNSDGKFSEVIGDLQKLMARLMTFPLVTVAAMNGHSYGGGGFLALAHDYRVMRSDRGWFCLPAAKYKRNLPVGLLEVIKARIPSTHGQITIAYGMKYTAAEAKAAGIINEVCSLERLKTSAIAAANKLAGEGPVLDRKTLTTLKRDLYHDLYQCLNEPVKFYSKL